MITTIQVMPKSLVSNIMALIFAYITMIMTIQGIPKSIASNIMALTFVSLGI